MNKPPRSRSASGARVLRILTLNTEGAGNAGRADGARSLACE